MAPPGPLSGRRRQLLTQRGPRGGPGSRGSTTRRPDPARPRMEWSLERSARPRVLAEERRLWANVMRVLAQDMEKRSQGSPKIPDSVTTPYANFKSNFAKRLSAGVPVASSPIATRWQQSPTRELSACRLPEARSAAGLSESPGNDTLTPGSFNEPFKTPVQEGSETKNSALHFGETPRALDRGWKESVASKGQKCLNLLFGTQRAAQWVAGNMQLCEQSQCVWKDLNILDWNFQNLVAIALGSAVYIWNGENHSGIENIDLSLTCNYISSVSWIKEGTCLAVATSEGEVQLWDVVTKKRLRTMLGHLSVVGALSWNHCILSSGSRLGRVYHHDVRVAQHRVGTLGHKQAVCALKWSPDGRLLSSGCSDGLLTIWPHDPGAGAQAQPLKVIPQSTAVKAMDWCPWQSSVLAVGGGMKDGCLHVLDINTGKSIQTPSTNSQICSLVWLPMTKEIATGQGTPSNDVTVWTCPSLSRSGAFFGHRGRVLHLALSPDQTRVFSAAADGTACVWSCCWPPRPSELQSPPS
nr:cell division cycle protein 20 homolog B isoform X2 [Oryctolagus cuniculus]